ncbi:MAG: hypothetical protein ACJ8DV_21055, partial [Microvirga sp.]
MQEQRLLHDVLALASENLWTSEQQWLHLAWQPPPMIFMGHWFNKSEIAHVQRQRDSAESQVLSQTSLA